ncbi:hypothetical protein ACFV0L_24195 [Streptosporangium canum]|uniref:hypothetical protein n=1 Tax=Streptosporangium canum TaxID=324952 RepID=UPI0036B79EB8
MAANQRGKVQQTGSADVVAAWVRSGAQVIRKPDAGLSEIAAKRCGMTLDAGGWMIGDDLAVDKADGRPR